MPSFPDKNRPPSTGHKPSTKPSGWEDLPEFSPTKLTRGLMIDIVGAEGTGKSSLALTIAQCGMVGYVDIDQSADRARRPDGKGIGKRIRMLPVRYSAGAGEEGTKQSCKVAWAGLEVGIEQAVSSWADAIIIDTDTEAWELKRLAAFGTVTPKGRTDRLYGPVNAQFRQLHRNVNRVHRKHLVTIHQVKEEYVDKVKNGEPTSVKTGKMVRASWKEIPYLADIIIRTGFDDGEFNATIEICKLDPAMKGMVIEQSDLDLTTIIAMATGTDAADWRK